MKKVTLFVLATFVGTCAFADMSSTGLAKNSAALNKVAAAWKTKPSVQPKQDPNDITIVYGGEDVSRRPLDPKTITL